MSVGCLVQKQVHLPGTRMGLFGRVLLASYLRQGKPNVRMKGWCRGLRNWQDAVELGESFAQEVLWANCRAESAPEPGNQVNCRNAGDGWSSAVLLDEARAGLAGFAPGKQQSNLDFPGLMYCELDFPMNPKTTLTQAEKLDREEPIIGASRAYPQQGVGGGNHLQTSPRLVGSEVSSQTEAWKRLCDKGRLVEAFQELILLLQQGRCVSNHMVYCVLRECVRKKDLVVGRRVHLFLLERGGNQLDSFFGNHIIRLYAAGGSLLEANKVFHTLRTLDTHVWASIISAHDENGQPAQAVQLYAQMRQSGIKPNDYVFVAALKACASAGDLASGKLVHADVLVSGFESNVYVGSTLVNLYAKCNSLVDARRVFDSLPTKNVVTWSAMIAGYAQNELGQEALDLYASMQLDATAAGNVITFVSVLKACGSIGAIQEGERLHAHILEKGLDTNPFVGSSLVDMYAKCGKLEVAHKVFDRLAIKDVVTWTALMDGYGQHNNSRMAIQCFQDMVRRGIVPNAATFTCLLVACSHVGLVKEGQQYFRSMVEDYGIRPTTEHYNCMVDLLARSGCLDAAENLLRSMPLGGDSVGWMSLLSACRRHGDVVQARLCFDRLLELDPEHPSGYVLMTNMYADAGRWEDVYSIEQLRKYAGAHKKAAKAVIEVKNKLHEFTVGEKREDISLRLKNLNLRLKKEGYVPKTGQVLKSMSDQEKEDALCGHAEKLAVAFGLLNTPEGTSLLVTKNLRMCSDCHSGTKIISSIEGREIVVRDAHRVHCFRNGFCSCGVED